MVIATPATSHYSICKSSLRAGKHCLVEKPLATSLQQASDLVNEADARGLVLAVGHVFLYNPSIRKVKDYLAQGELGSIHYLNMVRTNLGPPGIDVDVVWDLATHDISVANFWLGSTPVRVTANGGAWVVPDKIDSVFATLEYPAGEMAHVIASWLNPRKVRDIVVVGSRLMVTVDDMSPSEPLRVYDKGIDPQKRHEFVDTYEGFRSSIRDGDVRIPKITNQEPLREECRDFISSVFSGCAPASSGRSALPVVATIEAIHESLAARRTVTLVP
jgi:predicted dehydrogenase